MRKVWSEEGEGQVGVVLGHMKEARPLLVLTTTPSLFRAPESPTPIRQLPSSPTESFHYRSTASSS